MNYSYNFGKINFNVSLGYRALYSLIAILMLAIVGVGVYAFGTNSPNTFGYSLGEIAPPSPCTSPNNFLKFDGTNWVCADSGSSSQWMTSGSNIYYSTGRVGIGTNTPANALDVAGSISATGSIFPRAGGYLKFDVFIDDNHVSGDCNTNSELGRAYISLGAKYTNLVVCGHDSSGNINWVSTQI